MQPYFNLFVKFSDLNECTVHLHVMPLCCSLMLGATKSESKSSLSAILDQTVDYGANAMNY